MNAWERFERTLDFHESEGICTYDVLWHPEIYARFGGQRGDYLERNARMCRAVGLDATRGLFDPDRHWMQQTVDDWGRFFGIDVSQWQVSYGGGTAWISKRPFHNLETLARHLPQLPARAAIEAAYVPFLKRARQAFGSDAVYLDNIPGPLTIAYTYTDLELFALATKLAPELSDDLLNLFTEHSRMIMELWARYPPAPACIIGEDMAYKGGTLFSKKWMQENIWPRHRYILEPAKQAGFKCLLHSDGNLDSILDDLVNVVGIDGLNPIETAAGMNPAAIRRRYPKLALLGCIDTSHLLPYGSPAGIEAAVLDLVHAVGPWGLCVGSTNEVHVAVPVDNALAMYRAAHAYREDQIPSAS
jgi:hypothetical protein